MKKRIKKRSSEQEKKNNPAEFAEKMELIDHALDYIASVPDDIVESFLTNCLPGLPYGKEREYLQEMVQHVDLRKAISERLRDYLKERLSRDHMVRVVQEIIPKNLSGQELEAELYHKVVDDELFELMTHLVSCEYYSNITSDEAEVLNYLKLHNNTCKKYYKRFREELYNDQISN